MISKKKQNIKQSPTLPVEGGIFQKNLNANVLLQKAVGQDGHRGEADVVHRQIGRIIQGLGLDVSRRTEGLTGEGGLVGRRRNRDGATRG